MIKYSCGSVEDAAFVGGDHVFYVDEGVFSACLFQQLEGLADEVTQVEPFSLGVFDLVADA